MASVQASKASPLPIKPTAKPLDGKLAIVTGASRGIGEAVSRNLASKGATIVLNYTSDNSAETTRNLAASLKEEYGVDSLPIQADLSTTTGPAELIAAVKKHYENAGKFQIDIIINNAGIAVMGVLADVKIEDYDRCYNVNVRGPLLLVQAAEQYLPKDRSGRIVNVSSVSSTMGMQGQSVYGATKAALEAMTRSWARELAERATVNAINPGPVATDMWSGVDDKIMAVIKPYVDTTPLSAIRPEVDRKDFVDKADVLGGRPAYPEEIGGVVGMLCTPDASWVTGQVVCANGGWRFGI